MPSAAFPDDVSEAGERRRLQDPRRVRARWWWNARAVSDATDSLLSRLAGKLESSGYTVLPRTNDNEMDVIRDGHRLCLVFSEKELQRSLWDGQEDALIVWGPGVTVEESQARFMTIHLDESLETAVDENIDGRWRYSRGFFRR